MSILNGHLDVACEYGYWKLHNTLLNMVALTNSKCELTLLEVCSSSGSHNTDSRKLVDGCSETDSART
jgi:hypothetical protein